MTIKPREPQKVKKTPFEDNLLRMVNVTPEAVACMRGRGDKMRYDAEIAFDHIHYVVSSGHARYNEAKAAAQALVDIMLVDMRAAAAKHVDFLVKAKA